MSQTAGADRPLGPAESRPAKADDEPANGLPSTEDSEDVVEPAHEEYASSAPAPVTNLVQHGSSRDSTAIASGATTNALSILAAAQSSAEAAIGSRVDTDHIQSSHLDPVTDSPGSPTTGHEPMTIALVDGGSATLVFGDDSVVVAQNGL